MPKRRAKQTGGSGLEIVGLFCGFLAGYIVAEGFLARFMHPLHWLVAGVTAIVGYFVVVVWERWRPQRPG